MPRKIGKAEQAKPPLGSILKSARELNSAERLLTPKDAANFLRVSPSWLAKARMRGRRPTICEARPLRSLWRGRSGPVDEISFATVDERAVAKDDAQRVPALCRSSHWRLE